MCVDIESVLSHRVDDATRDLSRAQFAPLQGRPLFLGVGAIGGRAPELIRPVARAVVDARGHAHGAENGNADALGAQILMEAFGQRDDAEFGDAIGAQLPVRHEPGEACSKENVTAASVRDHARGERLDAMDRTPEVHPDGPVPVRVSHGLRWSEHRDAGVVKKDIDPAEFAPGPVGKGVDGSFVANVGPNPDHARACAGEFVRCGR